MTMAARNIVLIRRFASVPASNTGP
jgi:hypothetical protein